MVHRLEDSDERKAEKFMPWVLRGVFECLVIDLYFKRNVFAPITRVTFIYLFVQIIKWFLDFPGPPHIYSFHHMVQCGMKYDKLPGLFACLPFCLFDRLWSLHFISFILFPISCFSLFLCLFLCLLVCLFLCLFVSLFVCFFVCLFSVFLCKRRVVRPIDRRSRSQGSLRDASKALSRNVRNIHGPGRNYL